jgi:hypothetical protein
VATLLRVFQEQRAKQAQVEAVGRELAAALREATARLERARHGSGGPTPARPAAPALVVVRRGETETFRLLQERLEARGLARVVWDRRGSDRRRRGDQVAGDRRRADRRAPAPVTWAGLGYAVAEWRGPRLRIVRDA